jgi:septum formation inhibitor MinC
MTILWGMIAGHAISGAFGERTLQIYVKSFIASVLVIII